MVLQPWLIFFNKAASYSRKWSDKHMRHMTIGRWQYKMCIRMQEKGIRGLHLPISCLLCNRCSVQHDGFLRHTKRH